MRLPRERRHYMPWFAAGELTLKDTGSAMRRVHSRPCRGVCLATPALRGDHARPVEKFADIRCYGEHSILRRIHRQSSTNSVGNLLRLCLLPWLLTLLASRACKNTRLRRPCSLQSNSSQMMVLFQAVPPMATRATSQGANKTRSSENYDCECMSPLSRISNHRATMVCLG